MERCEKKPHSLIVGGTRGIGRSLVKIWAGEGHIVSVIARRPALEPDRDVQNVHYWAVDLLKQEKLLETLAEIISRNGKLGNLVFFQRYRGEDDDWRGEIETSLTATKHVIEYFVDKFDDAHERSIVIASSIASYYIALEQPLSYHVSKAGINQMVRYYAVFLGSKGIRVNSVSFGTVLKERSKDFYLQNKRLHDLYKKITPLGRMGTSEEVAHIIAFLCSSKASFITGQNIVIDGGVSLQWHESLSRYLTLEKY